MHRSLSLCLLKSLGWRLVGWLLLAAVSTSGTGCSFWAVRGPSAAPSGGDCTTSAAVPVLDGIFAAGFAGLGVAGLADQSASCHGGEWACLDFSGLEHGGAAALLGLAAVEVAATAYGGAQVAACHERKAKMAIPASQLGPAPGYHPGALPPRE